MTQLTLSQAATRSGLSERNLRAAAQRGALKATKLTARLWLTTDRDLARYLTGRPERFRHADSSTTRMNH